MMTPMLRLYKFISHIDRLPNDRVSRPVAGLIVRTKETVRNSYSSELKGDSIPAGALVQCDFGGDFGMYAIADCDGVLQRVKIDLSELHKLDFSDHEEVIARVTGAPAQGIEAATADETGTGSAVGESPVVEDHAPND